MSADRLFEMPEVEVDEPTSYGRRLTAKAREALKAGRHPATGLDLLGGMATCGGCTHLVVRDPHDRRFYKCKRHRLGVTRSAASDVRVGWPACTAYEERRP